MRLRALLAAERFPDAYAGSRVVAQCSSLGSLSDKWLLQEQFLPSMSAGRTESGA